MKAGEMKKKTDLHVLSAGFLAVTTKYDIEYWW